MGDSAAVGPTTQRGIVSRRRLALLVLGTVLLGGLIAFTGDRPTRDESGVPIGLQSAIDSKIAADVCVSAASAEPLVRAELAKLDLDDWVVERGYGLVRDDQCAGVGYSTRDQRILLIPIVSPAIRAALREAEAMLLRECLGPTEASEELATRLRAVGVDVPVIETDGGIGYEEGQQDAVLQHVDAGCFIYSNSGYRDDGVLTVSLGGRKPGDPPFSSLIPAP